MKKNKKIILSIILLIGLILLLTVPYLKIRNMMIEHDIYSESEKVQEAFQNYDVLQCKFGLLNLEYAFISHLHYVYPERNINRITLRIDHYKLNRKHPFSSKWVVERFGGTTVKNTTFPELVEMVKEDCSQFQENFDAEDPETQIDWGYREAEPPKTQEELKKEKEEEYYSMYNQYIDFSDEVKNLIRERYGDWENTEYDELLELSLQVAEDEEIGRMANPQWYEMMDQMDEDEEL